MTPRIARVVAWSAVAVGWALVVGAALLSWWAGDPAPSAPEFKGLIMGPIETLVLGLLLVGLFGGTGALIVSRFPANLLGWTFTFSALIVSATLVGSSYAYAGLVVRPGDLPGARVATVLLGDALWLPFVSIQIVGLLVLFPDGRLASSGRRWIFLLGLAGAVIGSLGLAISPEVYAIKLPNPLAFGPKVVSDTLAGIGFLMVLGAGIAAVASLTGRFRRSQGDERQQMKWFVYAAALMLVTLIPVTVLEDTPAWMQLLSGITTALLPVAVGVAILKYRLYDIDLVINKTLVYGIHRRVHHAGVPHARGRCWDDRGRRGHVPRLRGGRHRRHLVPAHSQVGATPREPPRVWETSDPVRGALGVLGPAGRDVLDGRRAAPDRSRAR